MGNPTGRFLKGRIKKEHFLQIRDVDRQEIVHVVWNQDQGTATGESRSRRKSVHGHSLLCPRCIFPGPIGFSFAAHRKKLVKAMEILLASGLETLAQYWYLVGVMILVLGC